MVVISLKGSSDPTVDTTDAYIVMRRLFTERGIFVADEIEPDQFEALLDLGIVVSRPTFVSEVEWPDGLSESDHVHKERVGAFFEILVDEADFIKGGPAAAREAPLLKELRRLFGDDGIVLSKIGDDGSPT